MSDEDIVSLSEEKMCESCGMRFQVICPSAYKGVVEYCPFCGESELKED